MNVNTTESARITQTIDNAQRFKLVHSHPSFVAKATSVTPLPDSATVKHMQLVLKPSASRLAALETLIADQHNPNSPQFDHWLTPQQYGANFGVLDADVTAATAWLKSQGFTVNTVYPNNTQIDFTGNVGQIRQAFQTQEAMFKVNGVERRSNAGDISIPAALQHVVGGAMGLSDVHANAFIKQPQIVQWNSATKTFGRTNAASKNSKSVAANSIGPAVPGGKSDALTSGSLRALVPNDMATIYGIRAIRANGVTGKGVTIAVVEDADMVPDDWTNFVTQFNLGQFGGSFTQFNPAPPNGPNNCLNEDAVGTAILGTPYQDDELEVVLDSEWATAIAPSAHVEVATCFDEDANFNPVTDNFFGGVFVAASNVVNGATRPDIISTSYGFGEFQVDSASKTAIDLMWAQADAEGISVFVSSGDSGTNPDFNGGVINGEGGNGTTSLDVNAFASSPHDTVVGGTDFADVLDGTTRQYFATTPSVVGGTALSYVPEIPWNQSCGNAVAAKALGFDGAPAYCEYIAQFDILNTNTTSEGTSGGASSIDMKPTWQRLVHNAAPDQSRDLPDVALFGGSWGDYTFVILCTNANPCLPGFTGPTTLEAGTSLSAPMFAGIQALIDQGLHMRGLPLDQGNAAPTLYALASEEYGGSNGTPPPSLSACNADNGGSGTANCVFHNVTRGSNSTQCLADPLTDIITPNCWIYDSTTTDLLGLDNPQIGLTTVDDAPTSYSGSNKAYGARPGWSFASGLGSVNATNLLIAWRAFDHAPSAAPSN